MIPILKNYGHNFDKNDTLKKIGTIGSDFLENKITSIDFKNQKIQLFDKKPNWMNSLSGFKKFDFTVRIVAGVFDFNKSSMKVLEKNGYYLESIRRNAVIKKGKIIDDYIWIKLKE